MVSVYNLILIDEEASYDNHKESFTIGFFSSYGSAEKIAKKYLTEVAGFKDYNVSYHITEKRVIGSADSLPTEVFIICGWNENDELDEIDVIESDCYLNENEAEQKLDELRVSCSRKEWCIDKYIVDECDWQEGFVKVPY